MKNFHTAIFALTFTLVSCPVFAEYDEEVEEVQTSPAAPEKTEKPELKSTKKEKRKYFIEDPNRVDAGTFHAGFAIGGNYYVEPRFTNNLLPSGDYFKDFGFQGGGFFDFDYEDIRLGLRFFIGYKYILNSAHVFCVDFIARYLFTMSDKVKFGIGLGPSLALWIRTATNETLGEEAFLLPFFVIEAGFDFSPFMVDFRFPIHRIGVDSTVLGMELYFGVRL